MTPRKTWFEVHEGMHNPRQPEEISWRVWGAYATSDEAYEEYRKLPKPTRTVRCEVVIEKI